MKNLIAKSQSLFLVAILAIFPSANAMSEEDSRYMGDKIKEVYLNVNGKRKELQASFEQFRTQMEQGLGGDAVNNDTPELVRTIVNGLALMNQEIVRINEILVALDGQQRGVNVPIDLNLSRAEEFLEPNQGAERLQNRQAANRMDQEEFVNNFNRYLAVYYNPNTTKGQKGNLTTEFKKFLDSRSNGTGLTVNNLNNFLAQYMGNNKLSKTVFDAIEEFLGRV